MKLKEFRDFCLSFEGVTEDTPFDDKKTIAFKVMGEIFALADEGKFKSITLKCDPVKAASLRNLYADVEPGIYMDKKHWNSINPQGNLDDDITKEWIKESYELIVEELPRKAQKKLATD